MRNLEKFNIQNNNYSLSRIPIIDNDSLRAWDAADELIVNTVVTDFADTLHSSKNQPILVINDAFGALALAFNKYAVDSWSDSSISHLATEHNLTQNLAQNKTDSKSTIRYIPATDQPQETYKIVLIKIPKTLSLLEDQLCRLKPHINKDTLIIGAAMTKHIHNSTLKHFENNIGTTTTSRATKKARLIFANNDSQMNSVSPYPKIITDEKTQLKLFNYANVFAKDKLDIGTRFLIQHIDQCPQATHIIDIGCGNGALGIISKRHQPNAKISFIDESYNAIASARDSYNNAYPESSSDANFFVSNALEQFSKLNSIGTAQLVLCNPPFHQVHSIGDHIAWEMFKQSRDALATDGEIWVVGNRHLGYHIKLKKVFGNCRTIASNPKFIILAAKKLDKLKKHST